MCTTSVTSSRPSARCCSWRSSVRCVHGGRALLRPGAEVSLLGCADLQRHHDHQQNRRGAPVCRRCHSRGAYTGRTTAPRRCHIRTQGREHCQRPHALCHRSECPEHGAFACLLACGSVLHDAHAVCPSLALDPTTVRCSRRCPCPSRRRTRCCCTCCRGGSSARHRCTCSCCRCDASHSTCRRSHACCRPSGCSSSCSGCCPGCCPSGCPCRRRRWRHRCGHGHVRLRARHGGGNRADDGRQGDGHTAGRGRLVAGHQPAHRQVRLVPGGVREARRVAPAPEVYFSYVQACTAESVSWLACSRSFATSGSVREVVVHRSRCRQHAAQNMQFVPTQSCVRIHRCCSADCALALAHRHI